MGYLEGFRVTFGKLFKGTETGRTVTVPYVKDSGPKREKPVVVAPVDGDDDDAPVTRKKAPAKKPVAKAAAKPRAKPDAKKPAAKK